MMAQMNRGRLDLLRPLTAGCLAATNAPFHPAALSSRGSSGRVLRLHRAGSGHSGLRSACRLPSEASRSHRFLPDLRAALRHVCRRPNAPRYLLKSSPPTFCLRSPTATGPLTIPKAIRGLFERERRLLGLLSRTAYEAVRRSFEALFARKDVRPGCVISIQTFGSYGANFNPHCHAIISDGVWSAEGEFLELPSLDTAAVCELFRRLLLRRLHKEERLSERFMENLLSWVHPGFSVFAADALST